MGLFGALAGAVKSTANKINSSRGNSGSGNGNGGGGGSGSGYGKNTNYSNESAYLNKLAQSGDYGTREWAKKQQAELDKAYRSGSSNSYSSLKRDEDGYSSMKNPYEDLLREQEERYASLQRAQEQARRAAIEQGVQRLESNRGSINQGFDETARQAYVQKMQDRQNLPQMLAGQGISGGGTESANIALDTSYGNNINQNEMARQNSLTGLDQAISDLRSSGDIGIAESNLALQQQQLADYTNAYSAKIGQDNWLKQYQQGLDDSSKGDYLNTIGAYADDYAAEINRLKAQGVSEDDYRIKSLKAARQEKLAGMQSAAAEREQQDFLNYIKKQQLYNSTRQTNYNVGKPYYKAATGGSKGGGKITYSQALRMLEMGYETPEVLSALGM